MSIVEVAAVAALVAAIIAGTIILLVMRNRAGEPVAVAAVSHPDRTAGVVSVLDGAGIKCDVRQDPTSDMWQITVGKTAETRARETLRSHAIGL